MSQMYEINITAMGEVRDAEGNLISSEPVEATMVVNEEEMRAITGGNTP
jgi:hypothetical protein